jgi:hypothetical protein
MTRHQIAKDPGPLVGCDTTPCEGLTTGVVVLAIDFRSKRHERVYDADKVWSGEHTILDYAEI